jgi:hypothetical protein
MWNAESWLILVKLLAAFLTFALGIFALLGNFRGSNGRLTKTGIATFVALGIAAVVSIFGVFFEDQKARSDSREQAIRTEKLLSEVSRAVQPLGKMGLSYRFELPSSDPRVAQYILFLADSVDKKNSELRKFPSTIASDSLRPVSFGLDGLPESVNISPDGEYWPHGPLKAIGALALVQPRLAFYRTPVSSSRFRLVNGGGSGAPDLMLSALPIKKGAISLEYEPKVGKLFVRGSLEFMDPLKFNNGLLTSVPDLYGSQLILTVETMDLSSMELLKKYANPEALELKRKILLDYAILRYGDSREAWLFTSDFERSQSPDQTNYSVTLPASDEGMRKLIGSRGQRAMER